MGQKKDLTFTLQILLAVGVTALFRFKYNGDRTNPKLTNQTRIYTILHESGGHDLFPVYGEEDKF